MYKIYINETPLFLVNTKDLVNNFKGGEDILIARYNGKVKNILNYVDMLEKNRRFRMVVIHSNDEKALIKDFDSLFKIIEAAGGLVFNEKKEMLVIFRIGFWDLPKGKIDKGEGKKAAAVREVEEETGLKDVQLGDFLKETYHTYRSRKNKRVLKRTFWYVMHSQQSELVPQAEEDIEKAIWIDPQDFLSNYQPVYGNILDVIHSGVMEH